MIIVDLPDAVVRMVAVNVALPHCEKQEAVSLAREADGCGGDGAAGRRSCCCYRLMKPSYRRISNCASNCFIVSMATPTTIKSAVLVRP